MFYLAFLVAFLVLLSCVSLPEEWPGRLSEFLRKHKFDS